MLRTEGLELGCDGKKDKRKNNKRALFVSPRNGVEYCRNTPKYSSISCSVAAILILSLYPEEEQLSALCVRYRSGLTALYWAAMSGDLECTTLLLSLCPESERLRAVSEQDKHAGTVLHCAAGSGNPELIKHILALYPENERLNVITGKCFAGTALHCAAVSGNVECFEIILAQIPESERLQVLNTTGSYGETVLH